nr:MAG TPA_asm: hypothetical protein [Caudoviricetes sp.]
MLFKQLTRYFFLFSCLLTRFFFSVFSIFHSH